MNAPSTSIDALDAVVRQGREDYLRSSSQYQPPFPFGSDEYNAYERGWMQALKRNSQTGAVMQQKWEELEKLSSPQPASVAPAYNAYERRKG